MNNVTKDYMSDFWDKRRISPGQFFQYAENAVFAAFVMENIPRAHLDETAKHLEYLGIPFVALKLSAQRELAFAIELVVKAVIAQRIRLKEVKFEKIETTHDIEKLWEAASLPDLSSEDRCRLIIASERILWSARYPAPNVDRKGENQHEKALERMRPFMATVTWDGLELAVPPEAEWDDLKRIYDIARYVYLALADRNP